MEKETLDGAYVLGTRIEEKGSQTWVHPNHFRAMVGYCLSELLAIGPALKVPQNSLV